MLEFCPKCQNLMKHQSSQGLMMQCHVCLHLEPIRTLTIYTDDYRPIITDQYPVHAELCEDKTLARTLKMTCPNQECPSNQASNKLKPEVVLFHYNSDYTQGYICCVCKSYWKQGLAQPKVELDSITSQEDNLAQELKDESRELSAQITIPGTTITSESASSSVSSSIESVNTATTATLTPTGLTINNQPATLESSDVSAPIQTQTQTQTQIPATSAMATGVMTELGQEAIKAKSETENKTLEADGTEEDDAEAAEAEADAEAEAEADGLETDEAPGTTNQPGETETPVAVTISKKGDTVTPASIPVSQRQLEVTSAPVNDATQPGITSRKTPQPRLKTKTV